MGKETRYPISFQVPVFPQRCFFGKIEGSDFPLPIPSPSLAGHASLGEGAPSEGCDLPRVTGGTQGSGSQVDVVLAVWDSPGPVTCWGKWPRAEDLGELSH